MYAITISSLINGGKQDATISSLEISQYEQERYIHTIDTFISSSEIEELILIYKHNKIHSLLRLIATRLACFRDDPNYFVQRAHELGFRIVKSPRSVQAYFQELLELLYKDDQNATEDSVLSVSPALPSPVKRQSLGHQSNDNQLNELNFEVPTPSYRGHYHESEIVFDGFDQCEPQWSQGVLLPNQLPESAEMSVVPELAQTEASDTYNKSDISVFGIEHIPERPVEVSTKSKFRCCSLQ